MCILLLEPALVPEDAEAESHVSLLLSSPLLAEHGLSPLFAVEVTLWRADSASLSLFKEWHTSTRAGETLANEPVLSRELEMAQREPMEPMSWPSGDTITGAE